MFFTNIVQLLQTIAIAFFGGGIFFLLRFPLPWVLGAMAAILCSKSFKNTSFKVPQFIKNGALFVLGSVFGLQITSATIMQVTPYLLPYLGITAAIIAACVGLGVLFSKWSKTDALSGIFGFIPGGLTEMVVTGESLGAKPVTVIFIQTARLLSVLSIVPFLVTVLFAPEGGTGVVNAAPSSSSPFIANTILWTYLLYLIPLFGGWLFRNLIPAAYVLVPMLVTAGLHMAGLPLPAIPAVLVVLSQLIIGIGLGESVSFGQFRDMGRHIWRVAVFVLLMIGSALAFGWLLSVFTGMDLPTALLSVAPGGLIEMGLTASAVGADAAVVTSLQMIRLYTIIGVVPIVLKTWYRRGGA